MIAITGCPADAGAAAANRSQAGPGVFGNAGSGGATSISCGADWGSKRGANVAGAESKTIWAMGAGGGASDGAMEIAGGMTSLAGVTSIRDTTITVAAASPIARAAKSSPEGPRPWRNM